MNDYKRLIEQLGNVQDALLDLAGVCDDEALRRETLAVRESYMQRMWALQRMNFIANGEKV